MPDVMSRERFDVVRQEICASGQPSADDNLLGMEIDCCAYLGDPAYAEEDPGLWRDMAVSRAEGAEWLITGRAHGRPEDAEAIGFELTRIWRDKLCYRYREAHTIERSVEEVALLAITQISPSDLWVTADVRVRLDRR